MAQVTAGKHRGCVVSGKVMNAVGQGTLKSLTVRPERGAMIGEVWYPPHEATVTVDPQGNWSAELVPSAFVGSYLVRIDRQRFRMVVPQEAAASFGAIAELLPE